MKRKVLALLAVLAAGTFSAAALADEAACLKPRLVQSWNNEGKHAIVVREIGGKRFRLELAGLCQGIENIVTMKVSSRGAGVCVERGDYITYTYHELGPQQCMIESVEPYEEEAPAGSQPSGE